MIWWVLSRDRVDSESQNITGEGKEEVGICCVTAHVTGGTNIN